MNKRAEEFVNSKIRELNGLTPDKLTVIKWLVDFATDEVKAINNTLCCTELPRWTNNDVDSAYLMGCMNVGGIDEISKELKRLEELGLKPHEAVGKVRGKW